jgi:hypothetical protein
VQSDPIGLGGGLNTFAYAESSPTKYADPVGLKIFLEFHPVGWSWTGLYHGKIVVHPENVARWSSHEHFEKHGRAAFGGGPDGMFLPFGPLHGGVNRPHDISDPSVRCYELRLMHGLSEDEVIERLLSLTASFQNGPRPNYTSIPWGKSEYNSNSYVHGLGLAAGLDLPLAEFIDVRAPGYANPVPRFMFGQ